MTHRLYRIEITLSIQAISKEVHACAARRVKTYGIPVKLRILPPDVRSENEPFRPDTVAKSLPPNASLRTVTVSERTTTQSLHQNAPQCSHFLRAPHYAQVQPQNGSLYEGPAAAAAAAAASCPPTPNIGCSVA